MMQKEMALLIRSFRDADAITTPTGVADTITTPTEGSMVEGF